jgi:APA family basic amino acid/polyamine antiporter
LGSRPNHLVHNAESHEIGGNQLAVPVVAVKSIVEPVSDSAGATPRLKQTLGPIELVLLGVGAIVGVGIFVLTGQAAATYAGPGVVISFLLAGVASATLAPRWANLSVGSSAGT